VKGPVVVSKGELVSRYCETQDADARETNARMREIASGREVEGWMLLQGADMSSSYLGQQVILPWGPGCTFKEVPQHPVSPRGLASDMSVVVATALDKETS